MRAVNNKKGDAQRPTLHIPISIHERTNDMDIIAKPRGIATIPGYSHYVINDEGEITNLKTKKKLKPYRASDGYL